MGYTHYFGDCEKRKPSHSEKGYKEFKGIINSTYIRLLSHIQYKGYNLLEIYLNGDDKKLNGENLFEECFHEYSWTPDKMITLILGDGEFNCCKTARKPYDLAVVLCLALAEESGYWDGSSDGDCTMFGEKPIEEAIKEYCKNELEDFHYDFDKLLEIYNDASKQLSTVNFEEDIEYKNISDIPEAELEYIAKQIKGGMSTVYLNNGQSVTLRLG